MLVISRTHKQKFFKKAKGNKVDTAMLWFRLNTGFWIHQKPWISFLLLTERSSFIFLRHNLCQCAFAWKHGGCALCVCLLWLSGLAVLSGGCESILLLGLLLVPGLCVNSVWMSGKRGRDLCGLREHSLQTLV